MAAIGIVAVHGVIPQQRYGFQDQVADELRTALDNFQAQPGAWKMTVVLPAPLNGVAAPSTDPTDTPTISRVHLTSETDPNDPVGDYFDVHEAYWSPIDKGKTNASRVALWLLNTIFLPINDTARFMEQPDKVRWDIGYVIAAMIAGALAFAGAFLGLAWALGTAAQKQGTTFSPHDAVAFLAAPFSSLKDLNLAAVIALVAGCIGAYLAAQTIRAIWSLSHNWEQLRTSDGIQLRSRLAAIGVMATAALAGILFCMFFRWDEQAPLRIPGLVLVVAFLLLQSGRALLFWFLANFFGDVQIYTTRDENSDFFAMREQILDLVTKTIRFVTAAAPPRTPYDRVHVLAHSLGSSIALDALLRIYNGQKVNISDSLAWARIRSFVTFGTALEKTKYFFNVWNPTPSQAQLEWQNDLYGPLFTADLSALNPPAQTHGIYWLNCWYFTDFVSDSINSYRSFVLPGQLPSTARANRQAALNHARQGNVAVAGRLVAENRVRFGDFAFPFHLVTHGDYLSDQEWFWEGAPQSPKPVGAIDVVTSGLEMATPHSALHALNKAPSELLPYEEKPLSKAAEFRTSDVITGNSPAEASEPVT